MLITNPRRLQALDLDLPWLCGREKLAVNQVLAVMRDNKPEKMALRHVSGSEIGWTTPNQIENVLAVCVSSERRAPFDVFVDEKHMRRPATRPGALAISDFRISGYADLRGQQIDNTVIFIPTTSMDAVAEELRVPRIEAVRNLFEEDHVDEIVLRLIEITRLAIERPAEANLYFLDHLFGAMCSHIAYTYGGMERPRVPRRGALSPLQERRIKTKLLEQLAEPPSLQDLASSCDLSLSQFSRAFKASTGMPPHQWLLAERVKRAKDLLQGTKSPVNDVALECGFADQSHLTRVFSRSVGMSPAVWRRDGTG